MSELPGSDDRSEARIGRTGLRGSGGRPPDGHDSDDRGEAGIGRTGTRGSGGRSPDGHDSDDRSEAGIGRTGTRGSGGRSPDRLVLVTGATGGIGEAVARALAPSWSVLLGGRDPGRLGALAAELGARPWRADLTDPDDLERALAGLPELDALVHCAGSYDRGEVGDLPVALWQRAFQLNVFAAVRLTQAALPSLRRAGGTVVFLNSGAGLFTYRTGSLYSATKHALRAFADTLRAEEEGNGVRVTSVHPGRVDTELLRRSVDAFEDGAYEQDAYLRPEEVAALIVTALELRPGVSLDELRIRPTTPTPLR